MNEQELRQALSALEVYKAQLESILEQQQLVQVSVEEYGRAKATLTDYKNAAEGDEVLMPIGGSSFVRAKVVNGNKVLIGVGSGITVEKDVGDAMQVIDTRMQEMLDAMKKLNESRQVIEMKSNQLSQMIQAEYESMDQKSPL